MSSNLESEGSIREIWFCWNGLQVNREILITIDTDFGQLIFQQGISHAGLIRLPDVGANERLRIPEDVLDRFSDQLQHACIITVRGGRVRISRAPE